MSSSSKFADRFLKLQRDVFVGENKKQAALAELRRIAGDHFATAVEALAVSSRTNCTVCGRDYMRDEIGESGMCTKCFDNETEAHNER